MWDVWKHASEDTKQAVFELMLKMVLEINPDALSISVVFTAKENGDYLEEGYV